MNIGNKKEEKIKLRGIVKCVYKKMGKAILDYNMLDEGDKILVVTSGDINDLSLIKLFMMRKRRAPIKFDFVACFISTNLIKVDKKAVIGYFEENGVPFVIKELELEDKEIDSLWCFWGTREVLFETAREYGCDKIALSHLIDDITETILMNLFFLGRINAVKPRIDLVNSKVNIIRPLCYITKKEIKNFSSKLAFPSIHYKCMYTGDKRRELVKDIIRVAEKSCPYTRKNIFGALENIKENHLV